MNDGSNLLTRVKGKKGKGFLQRQFHFRQISIQSDNTYKMEKEIEDELGIPFDSDDCDSLSYLSDKTFKEINHIPEKWSISCA